MSFNSELDVFFKAGTGLTGVNGLWLDKAPTNHAKSYPVGILNILPTSGRLKRTMGNTDYENVDVRMTVYATTEALASGFKSSIQTRFESSKPVFSAIRVGDCERTGSLVRYAGKDSDGTELWSAVYTCRFTLEI